MGQVKTILDYYEIMYQKFPTVPKKDIERILKFCWKCVYLCNSYGGDVIVTNKHFWCYFGHLTNNPTIHFTRYIRKLAIKFRVLYKRKKIKWNGYYYFGLTDKLYDNLITNCKNKKKKQYGNQVFYKIFDECRLRQWNRKYIYRIPMLIDCGFSFYKENFVTDKAELIYTRDKITSKDILVENAKYELLNGTKNCN